MWVSAQQGAIDARTFEQLNKAQELAEQKQHAEALAVLDQLKGNDRLNSYARSQLWNFYAFIYASQEDYRKAIDAYQRVLKEEDATEGLKLTAKYTTAQLYFQLEDYDRCIQFMEDWLRTAEQPTPTAHIMLAQAYYQKANYDKALSNVDRAVSLEQAANKPVQESWLRLKAALYFSKQDYAKTASTYEDLIRLYPKASYMRQLAGMYSELGEDSKRLAVYDAVYEHGALSKENELMNLAFMWLGQDVPYKAGQIIEAGMAGGQIASSPKNVEALANAWAQANEHKKAVPALIKAAELSKDGLLYARLAGVYFNAGDYGEAAKAAVQADRMGGLRNASGNLMLMGMAYFNAGDYEPALQSFRRAKSDKGAFSSAAKWESYTLAEVERLRQLERAQTELKRRTEEALQAQENNVDAINIAQ